MSNKPILEDEHVAKAAQELFESARLNLSNYGDHFWFDYAKSKAAIEAVVNLVSTRPYEKRTRNERSLVSIYNDILLKTGKKPLIESVILSHVVVDPEKESPSLACVGCINSFPSLRPLIAMLSLGKVAVHFNNVENRPDGVPTAQFSSRQGAVISFLHDAVPEKSVRPALRLVISALGNPTNGMTVMQMLALAAPIFGTQRFVESIRDNEVVYSLVRIFGGSREFGYAFVFSHLEDMMVAQGLNEGSRIKTKLFIATQVARGRYPYKAAEIVDNMLSSRRLYSVDQALALTNQWLGYLLYASLDFDATNNNLSPNGESQLTESILEKFSMKSMATKVAEIAIIFGNKNVLKRMGRYGVDLTRIRVARERFDLIQFLGKLPDIGGVDRSDVLKYLLKLGNPVPSSNDVVSWKDSTAKHLALQLFKSTTMT